jgi:hypothetical protein
MEGGGEFWVQLAHGWVCQPPCEGAGECAHVGAHRGGIGDGEIVEQFTAEGAGVVDFA